MQISTAFTTTLPAVSRMNEPNHRRDKHSHVKVHQNSIHLTTLLTLYRSKVNPAKQINSAFLQVHSQHRVEQMSETTQASTDQKLPSNPDYGSAVRRLNYLSHSTKRVYWMKEDYYGSCK